MRVVFLWQVASVFFIVVLLVYMMHIHSVDIAELLQQLPLSLRSWSFVVDFV